MLIDLCKTVFKTKYVPGKLETVAYRASAGECGRSSELDSAQAQLAIHIYPEKEQIKVGEICGNQRFVL